MGVNLFNETTMGTFVYSYSLLSVYDVTREMVYSRGNRGILRPASGAGISALPSPGLGISQFGDPEPCLGLGHITVWGSRGQLGPRAYDDLGGS